MVGVATKGLESLEGCKKEGFSPGLGLNLVLVWAWIVFAGLGCVKS